MFGHHGDRALGVASVNCLVGQPGQFTEQVMATHTAWGKQHLKIEAYHWVLAFGTDELDPGDPEAVSKALELASTMARLAWLTRQTLLVAQNDGESGLLHVHVLVGSVDPLTDRAARGDDMSWTRVAPIQWLAMDQLGMTQSAKAPHYRRGGQGPLADDPARTLPEGGRSRARGARVRAADQLGKSARPA